MIKTAMAAAMLAGLTLATPAAAYHGQALYTGRVISGTAYGAFGTPSCYYCNTDLAGLQFTMTFDFDTGAPNLAHFADDTSELVYGAQLGSATLTIATLPAALTFDGSGAGSGAVQAIDSPGENWFHNLEYGPDGQSYISFDIYDALTGPRISDLTTNYNLAPGYNYGDVEIHDSSRFDSSFAVLGVTSVSFKNDDPLGVPEPAGWALMIAGFGVIGAAARRRRLAAVVLA